MVIEITKRYIVNDNTLDNIVKSFIDCHYDYGEEIYENKFLYGYEDFFEWLENEMNNYYYDDETVYNNDIYKLKDICEKTLKLKIEEKNHKNNKYT